MSMQLYIQRESWIQRLDPRAKLLALVIAFIPPLVFNHPLYTGVIFLLYSAVALAVGAGPNIRRLKPVLWGIQVAAFIMWPIFIRGETQIFAWLSVENVMYALSMGFRLNAMVMAGMVFLTSTSIEHMVWGLVHMGLNYRVGFAITTAIRLVPMLLNSAVTIGEAQASRGLDLEKGSLIDRTRRHVPLIVPVFMSSIRRTNDFSMALEARGFSAPVKRSFYFESHFGRTDYLALGGLLLFLAVTILLSHFGWGSISGLRSG